MKRYLFAIVLSMISGCASVGTPITQSNTEVRLPHYSLVVPPDKGWQLSTPDNNKLEVAVLTKDIGPIRFRIQTMWVAILDEKMRSVPAKTVADDYRNLERQTMLKEGVERGQYQLNNVVMKDEIIKDKNFFVMTYAKLFPGSQRQLGKLHLFFPKEERNDFFILVLYVENVLTNTWTDPKPQRNELEEMLMSLRVRE